MSSLIPHSLIKSAFGSKDEEENQTSNDKICDDDSVKVLKVFKYGAADESIIDPKMIKALGGMSLSYGTLMEVIKDNKIENFHQDQDYYEIKKKFSKNKPFVDEVFPPSDKSIHFTDAYRSSLRREGKIDFQTNKIRWKRAYHLTNNPQFVVDKNGIELRNARLNESNYKTYFQTTDLDQGFLGNCWFISAATGIIQNFKLFKTVVPFDNNTFNEDEYTGAFHFRFWIYGKWKDVVIDDYLPVGPDNRLIFCKNKENPNEFWSALFEKAYAKICGSYEGLEGGLTSEALIDMSGGIEETFDLLPIKNSLSNTFNKGAKDNKTGQPLINADVFWDILCTAKKRYSVIGCNIDNDEQRGFNSEVKLSNGLVMGHAYVLTALAIIKIQGALHRLMRIYNPWGNDVEWNGDWSDKSNKWREVDNESKKQLEFKTVNDGEFWISYTDWLKNYDNCQICNLSPNTICDLSEEDWKDHRLLSSIYSLWSCQYMHGKWVLNESTGGSGQRNPEKFWTNPNLTFMLTSNDMIKDGHCWVIIALMQKNSRNKRIELKINETEEYIQYRLYKIESLQKYSRCVEQDVPFNPFDMEKVGSSGAYVNKREVTQRFALGPGGYVIIPSTYDEDVEGEFLLRIFTEKPLNETNKLRKQSTLRQKTRSKTLQSSFKEAYPDEIRMLGNFIHLADDLEKKTLKHQLKYIEDNLASRFIDNDISF